ncbi:hypothetical protein CAPTEDRAFT_188390 [Capitella teleta]|uniref:BZIP domain-containing protein n=1 Tax=Capitella teleta TaxID=283909 RepID=R7TRN0_CAPTE|nr:hypothetical protein CAPTEDRAFT_188390 [Capitella teleta]|eukprot:ELT96573.1 hypothetical protein CAPTEDRAFT_188390 [Capitella teleta]
MRVILKCRSKRSGQIAPSDARVVRASNHHNMDLFSQMLSMGEVPNTLQAPIPPTGASFPTGGLGHTSPDYPSATGDFRSSPSPHMYSYSPASPYKMTSFDPVDAKGSISASEGSPLGLEAEELDMTQLEAFVQDQLAQEEANNNVSVKTEPIDDFDDDDSLYGQSSDAFSPSPVQPQPAQRRRGGRPRDPVVFADGVPPIVVIKKERRKEQNRRAARKCREKKKAQTEHVLTDYHRVKIENSHLKDTVTELRRKLRDVEHSWRIHGSKCSTLPTLSMMQ